MITPQVLNRVRAGYNTIRGGHPEDYNPVKKVPLHIFRVENQVQIKKITREPENNGEENILGGATATGNIGTNRDYHHNLQTLFLLLSQLSRLEADHHQDILRVIASIHKQQKDSFTRASTNFSRYMMRPVVTLRRHAPARANAGEVLVVQVQVPSTGTVSLSKHPRTLLLLWHEYLHGLGNNKAVKDFSREERGQEKQKYSKRKLFWDVMCNLLRAGFTETCSD